IERIHNETGGWPHLVQLVAECIIDLLNEEGVQVVNKNIFFKALSLAIVRGHNVFFELMKRESILPGEWEYLATFRRQVNQPIPDNEKVVASLRRRLLIEEEGDEWRLRIPLMRQWLYERGSYL
ncbi:MAG: hypothetical protein ACJ754_27685, partial [Pyrinomonadaceae bacterium]